MSNLSKQLCNCLDNECHANLPDGWACRKAALTSNLVTKLRELYKFWHETDELKEAADEIERLRADWELAKTQLDRLVQVETERARLREALVDVSIAETLKRAQDVATAALSGDSSAPETKARLCECIPLAPRPYKFCQDCGGQIPVHQQQPFTGSAQETSAPLTPAEMGTVARMAAVSAQVQPEKASTHPACIWRGGCKHPEVCNANLRCVPGGIEGQS